MGQQEILHTMARDAIKARKAAEPDYFVNHFAYQMQELEDGAF